MCKNCQLQIPIAATSHTVVSLNIHEPGSEPIYWQEGKEAEKEVQLRSATTTSKLTAWFALNQTDEQARNLSYLDIPKLYVLVNTL